MPDSSNFEFSKTQPANVKSASRKQPASFSRFTLQNRWDVFERLGQGGMGTVFLARDLRLSNRLSVVKRLRVDSFDEDERDRALAFFQREAMVLSSLKHPNIVSVLDYFEEAGHYYLVMEYVEGRNLQQLLVERGRPFEEDEVRQWATCICDVLHYLHTHHPPVIYRDLKPSNIMLDTSGDIKLVDFGIARPYLPDSDNTHVVSGGYSPPEQYWGGADVRSDIYALGATMHFLTTGKEPLALQSSSPRKRNNKISNEFDHIVRRATAQDVWLRQQSAYAMREELINSNRRSWLGLPSKAMGVAAFFLVAAVLVVGLVTVLASNKQITEFQKFFEAMQSNKTITNPDSEADTDQTNIKRTNLASVQTKSHNVLDNLSAHPTAEVNRKTPVGYVHSRPSQETREEMLTDPEGLSN